MSAPLSIWHLCSNRWNSAITEYALSAARALDLAGHQTLFVAKAGTPAAKRAAALLPTAEVPDFTAGGLLALRAAARQNPPHIIVTYGGPETFLARLLKALQPLTIVRFQGQALSVKPFQAVRHRWAHRAVDLILTPSQGLAAAVQKMRPWQPVISVPLGCDSDRYQHRPSAASADRPELLVFGRLDPVKGHAAIIQRLASVLSGWAEAGPPPRLHIVGEPANLAVAAIEAYTKMAGLRFGEDVLVSARRIEDVAALLSKACLGVVPSLGSEIICRVAEEFLLCGTPVAVSGVGSLDEVLFTGAGFSYAGLDSAATDEAFRHWISLSMSEPPVAKGRRAQTARQLFSLEAMANGLTNALRRL